MPRLPGHDHVHQDHVGLRLARLEDGVPRVAGLADDLDPVLGLEHLAQAGADDGVVVDDQDADRLARHRSGTSATIVVPASRARLELQLAAQQREPLAHPEQAETLGAGVGHEAAAVVLDHRRDRARAAREHDADRARLRVLDDVRQRLLHDPVERGLDVARQPVADARLELDPHPGLLGEGLAQALERGDEAEVVERLRPQLDREPADVVQRLDDLLAHGGERRGPLLVGPRLLDGLQPEQHRRQLLPGLVVQLAREPAPLELLRLDDPAQRVAGDARREVDGDGGARRERLGEPQVGLGEAGVAAFAVVRDDDADRPAARRGAARRARCGRRGAGPTPGRPRDRRGASRSARRGGARGRGRSSSRPARAAGRRSRPRPRRRPPRSGASRRRPGSAIVTSRAPISSRSRRAISSSRRASSISLASAVPTSFSASSWSDQAVAAS